MATWWKWWGWRMGLPELPGDFMIMNSFGRYHPKLFHDHERLWIAMKQK
jgi:hypothetical protein